MKKQIYRVSVFVISLLRRLTCSKHEMPHSLVIVESLEIMKLKCTSDQNYSLYFIMQ